MRVRIVVEDAERAHTEEAKRGFRHHEPRPKGTVHAECDTDCPNGLPNCRHCGDPEYAESCAAAGHCPDCGTKHGVAPDAVLVKHGFRLEPV